MSNANHITKEYLNEIFTYEDGNLYWKNNVGRIKKGSVAGSTDKSGYTKVMINKKYYRLHRIIFLLHHGYLPSVIDHKDGNPLNNTIENLREASLSKNQMNSKMPITNKSGVKGVCFHKLTKKWQVTISVNGVYKSFGLYNDIDYAKFVADAMRYKYHQKFARCK